MSDNDEWGCSMSSNLHKSPIPLSPHTKRSGHLVLCSNEWEHIYGDSNEKNKEILYANALQELCMSPSAFFVWEMGELGL